ncbi:MAG: hypothetical protein R6U32_04120 [Candidatus Woesearchaeota archaeon]
MVDQKTLDYVKKAVKKGFSPDDISKVLEKHGHSRRDIDEALWVARKEAGGEKSGKGTGGKTGTSVKESGKAVKKVKKGDKKGKKLEKPEHPGSAPPPEMPEHIKPKKEGLIKEVEEKAEEKIHEEMSSAKKHKHFLWVILEIILGVILFAVVGILMYMYMWPALLNVR